ncbi:hypothetical protein PG984_016434 [Apiospora sp. TS-2023a]
MDMMDILDVILWTILGLFLLILFWPWIVMAFLVVTCVVVILAGLDSQARAAAHHRVPDRPRRDDRPVLRERDPLEEAALLVRRQPRQVTDMDKTVWITEALNRLGSGGALRGPNIPRLLR